MNLQRTAFPITQILISSRDMGILPDEVCQSALKQISGLLTPQKVQTLVDFIKPHSEYVAEQITLVANKEDTKKTTKQ